MHNIRDCTSLCNAARRGTVDDGRRTMWRFCALCLRNLSVCSGVILKVRLSRHANGERAMKRLHKIGAAVVLLALGVSSAGQAVPASADSYFSQTGRTVWGVFEQYWLQHGGLA